MPRRDHERRIEVVATGSKENVMNKSLALGIAALALVLSAGSVGAGAPAKAPAGVGHVGKTDVEWQKALTSDQYRVLRKKGTEIAFTGKYWNNHADGTYLCAGCGLELFTSAQKFDSGTGWPSFWAPVEKSHVAVGADHSLG